MTVTTTTRTDPAARLTKGCMLIVFGLLVNVAPVAAADKDMSKEYSTCIDKSNGVTRTYLYGPAVCCKPDVSDGGIGLALLYPARE